MKKDSIILSLIILVVVLFVSLVITITMLILRKDENKHNDDSNNNIIKDVIILEGMEEEINTINYSSNLGYRIRYDIDIFNVKNENNKDIISSIYNEETYVVVEKINDNYDKVISNFVNKEEYVFNGNKGMVVNKTTNNQIIESYYIDGGNCIYLFSVYYPSGDTGYIEGFASRVWHMINTITIN